MFSWRQSTRAEFSDRGKQLPAFKHMLERAKNGESEAIAGLYRHFLPGVFAYIAARIPDRSTAEDLTSEVFLKMVEGIDKVRTHEEAGIAAWLFQVARVTIAGYYRQREKQPDFVPLEPTGEKGDTDSWGKYDALVNHPDTDPIQYSESREEWDTVVCAINCLTEEQRQVLVGRLILGYDVATVARMIGKQPNAVKALQFRALQSLNRILKKNRPPETALTAQRRTPYLEDAR